MDFDLSTEVLESISSALDAAESQLSEEQIYKIVNKIDEAIPGVVELLVGDTESYWLREADESGTGWGRKYANAIRSRIKKGEGSVYLDESVMDGSGKPAIMFAKMVEGGVKSWSIKEALLNSEKAKIGKDGIKYIIIPLPAATPKAKGTGRQLSRYGGREMTAEIHNLVKNGSRAPAGTLSKSGKDISGLTRYETRQHHSQYGIFRRVSAKSQGWQYPNVAPTPVWPNVKEYVERRIVEVLGDFCKEIIRQNS